MDSPLILGVLLLMGITPLASAAVHNLFVPNLKNSARIHALAFDDVVNTLTKLNSFQTDSTYAWIQFDVRESFSPPPSTACQANLTAR